MKNILKVGVPVALQDGFIQISFIIITIFANQRGLNDAAAVGIVEKIIGILFLVPSTMLSTISALASQNIGAGKHDRARLTLKYVLGMTVGYGAARSNDRTVCIRSNGLVISAVSVSAISWRTVPEKLCVGLCICRRAFLSERIFLCIWIVNRIIYPQFVPLSVQESVVVLCAHISRIRYFRWDVAAPAGINLSIIVCVIVLVWMDRHPDKYMGNKD